MVKYKIKYIYDSGDSFKNIYDIEAVLELEWKDLDIASKNLQRIKTHYEQYKKLNSRTSRGDIQKILQINKNEDWFVNQSMLVVYDLQDPEHYNAIDETQLEECKKQGLPTAVYINPSLAESCIILYTDENKPFQFWAPWCGYFETLKSVEIITVEDTSKKIIF